MRIEIGGLGEVAEEERVSAIGGGDGAFARGAAGERKGEGEQEGERKSGAMTKAHGGERRRGRISRKRRIIDEHGRAARECGFGGGGREGVRALRGAATSV